VNQKIIKILIYEDWQTRAILHRAIYKKAYDLQQFDDIEKAIEYLCPGDCQVLLLGLDCKNEHGNLDGLHAIPIIRKIDPNLCIIAIAQDDSLEMERKARLAGVFYYLIKPLDENEVRLSVTNAVHKYERLLGHEKMDMDNGNLD
jgi:DNA-binding NtrC family response regulator